MIFILKSSSSPFDCCYHQLVGFGSILLVISQLDLLCHYRLLILFEKLISNKYLFRFQILKDGLTRWLILFITHNSKLSPVPSFFSLTFAPFFPHVNHLTRDFSFWQEKKCKQGDFLNQWTNYLPSTSGQPHNEQIAFPLLDGNLKFSAFPS